MLNSEELASLPADRPLAITNVRLFAGEGAGPVENATVVVRDGRIEAAGPASNIRIPEEAYSLDGNGYTLIPGLMDCHVHTSFNGEPDFINSLIRESPAQWAIRAGVMAGRLLAAGFTTVRDVGSEFYVGVGLKRSINQGLIPGPHMVVAGHVLSITGGHGDVHFCPHVHVDLEGIVDGPEDMRKKVRTEIKYGVDLIKMCATGGVMSEGDEPGAAQFTIEEMQAAADEAHKAGKRTAAHAIGTAGIKNAIRAGIDTIEHGCLLDDEGIELLVQYGVYLVPTLAAPYNIVRVGLEGGIPAYAVEKASALVERHRESVGKARQAGVKIAMGTDVGTPFNFHGSNAFELELLTEVGFSSAEAISASTIRAAEAIGVEKDRGTLVAGKRADMVLVEGDPLANIRLLQDKAKLTVFKDGRLVAQGGKLVTSI